MAGTYSAYKLCSFADGTVLHSIPSNLMANQPHLTKLQVLMCIFHLVYN